MDEDPIKMDIQGEETPKDKSDALQSHKDVIHARVNRELRSVVKEYREVPVGEIEEDIDKKPARNTVIVDSGSALLNTSGPVEFMHSEGFQEAGEPLLPAESTEAWRDSVDIRASMRSDASEQQEQYRSVLINRPNLRAQRCLFCCTRRVAKYKDNKVSTSKYNLLTFLPLNLLLQFSKMANLYFLVLTIMELVPDISDADGKPVLAAPLLFVVGLSMIKDAYEDLVRHRQDTEENARKVQVGASFKKGQQKTVYH